MLQLIYIYIYNHGYSVHQYAHNHGYVRWGARGQHHNTAAPSAPVCFTAATEAGPAVCGNVGHMGCRSRVIVI